MMQYSYNTFRSIITTVACAYVCLHRDVDACAGSLIEHAQFACNYFAQHKRPRLIINGMEREKTL